MKIIELALGLWLIAYIGCFDCGHSQSFQPEPKKLENNYEKTRMLQERDNGKIRIFMDYSLLKLGGRTEINTIKRAMNISANYFYNVLNVTRLERLYYEEDNYTCGKVQIPKKYGPDGQGVVGDLGIICRNQQDPSHKFLAQAKICSYLAFNNRPIWGMINWNNAYLKYDQRGFQDLVFAAIHQLIHVLGFSADAYSRYPQGNPLVTDRENGLYLLSTPLLDQEIKHHFDCPFVRGLPLEDQDGSSQASSHWQSKVLGNELMGPSIVKNSMMSKFTLALLDSTGWYTSVNYSFAAEPNPWGKGKGCGFLNIDNCDFDEFCNEKKFLCEGDGTGIGRCEITNFKGSCKTPKSYINLICTSQNYEYQNLNAKLNAKQRGGHLSKCFESDYREQSLNSTLLNHRCYISVCSPSGKYMFILVGSYIQVCRRPGQILKAPVGMVGTLTCPEDMETICSSKKMCPYHCNKNGACIDGKCLCTGKTSLASFCADQSILIEPVGQQGGLKNIFQDPRGQLTIDSLNLNLTTEKSNNPTKRTKVYSINSKCLEGTFFDSVFGICLSCKDHKNCQSCTQQGCTICDDGTKPKNQNKTC